MSNKGVAPPQTRLYVFHHGNMYMDARRLVQKRQFYQRHSDLAPKDLWLPIPVLTALVVHPEGLLLFDVGATADWKERWHATGHDDMVPYLDLAPEQRFQTLIESVAPLSAIDWIVVSHLHMDHCGNLRCFEGAKAVVLIQEAEYQFATEQVQAPGVGGYVRSEYDVDVRWRVLNGDLRAIMQGVDVIALPGHAAGSQGLVVRLQQSGTIVLASDAAYTLESLGPPPLPGATLFNQQEWIRSIGRLNLYRCAEKALIIAGHDMDQLKTLALGPDAYYD